MLIADDATSAAWHEIEETGSHHEHVVLQRHQARPHTVRIRGDQVVRGLLLESHLN